MLIDHTFYMKLALDEAWKYQGLTYPNPAVGCTVVGEHGEILAVQAHQKAGQAHAEVNALKIAYYNLTQDTDILALTISSEVHRYLLSHHNNLFKNIKLYTTLEPCAHSGKTPSCAVLIGELGIKEVYVGSYDRNDIAKNGSMILTKNSCEVHTELMQKECDSLLFPFHKTLKDNFVFFKWAQRLNATIDDGNISSLESRKSVHAMRNVCDLLVVGGNTVRTDRPTLDARLVQGKAPDILILSNQKDFDRTIPLFDVANRKVFIENDLKKIKEYKNIMIEGGTGMYRTAREIVDYYLCYIAPHFGGKVQFNAGDDKFDILNMRQEREDIIMWMKRI